MPTNRSTKLLHNRLEMLTSQIEKKKLELQMFAVARELLMDSDDEASAERPQNTHGLVPTTATASAPTAALERIPTDCDHKSDKRSPPPIPTPANSPPADFDNMSLRHFIK